MDLGTWPCLEDVLAALNCLAPEDEGTSQGGPHEDEKEDGVETMWRDTAAAAAVPSSDGAAQTRYHLLAT